jgi:hypothetical protein
MPEVDKVSGKSRSLQNLTGGSRKGKPNKTTKALKEMILGALDDAGGQQYLADQAAENPGAFLSLIGKVLPSEIKAEHSGPDGGPMTLAVNVSFVRPTP